MMRDRRGIALTAALIAVVLIGALITGAFIATLEETRMSANAVSRERALDAAESAVETQIVGWSWAAADSQPIGSMLTTSGGPGVSTTTLQIRLDSTVFWVIGESRSGGETAAQSPTVRMRIGVLVKTESDSIGHRLPSVFDRRAWAELY